MSASGHSRLLKILHIDPEKNWGGGEAQVFGLLQYLAERGHSNDVATHPDGRLFQRLERASIRRIPLIVRNDLHLSAVPAIRRLIRREGYDIVHLHTKRAHVFSAWLPHAARRPKYLVTRRMDYPERANLRTRWMYNRRVDGVVAVSRSILELLIRAGVNPNSIRLIYDGIDPRPFQAAAAEGKTSGAVPVVGVLAVLEPRKGHRFLLAAARILKDRGQRVSYHIAGDGSERGALERMAETLGLDEEVSFAGFIEDAASFLAAIDILVLPSLHEGLGVAALEGMAAGKPVIGSRVGGLAESIIDGETGLLVPPGDAVELARAVADLLAAPERREHMGRSAARRVAECFTMERMAKSNEQYYYSLLEGDL